jgi:hypothetical protein
MWRIQEPKRDNYEINGISKRKNGECAACLKYSVFIFVEKIYKMQHLEGSGTPVLYIYDARFLKVKVWHHRHVRVDIDQNVKFYRPLFLFPMFVRLTLSLRHPVPTHHQFKYFTQRKWPSYHTDRHTKQQEKLRTFIFYTDVLIQAWRCEIINWTVASNTAV